MGQKFIEVTRMGKILEDGIKSGRIQDYTTLQAARKEIQYHSINGDKKKNEDISAAVIDQGHKPSQTPFYLNQPHQPIYPYHYGETSQMLYYPPLTTYPVYNTQANYYQPRASIFQTPHPYQPV